MNKFKVFMLTIMAWLLLLGCGGTAESDTAVPADTADIPADTTDTVAVPTPTEATDNALVSLIRDAEMLWIESDVTSYEIEVRHSRPTWSTQIVTLRVIDGEVVESTHNCFPERDCILQPQLDPAQMTIANLFQQAYALAGSGLPIEDINFNETYGFPTAIFYEDGSWVAQDFSVIEPQE